jgi:hypothetical protein
VNELPPPVYLVAVEDVPGLHWATRDNHGTYWRWRADGTVTPEQPAVVTRLSGPIVVRPWLT